MTRRLRIGVFLALLAISCSDDPGAGDADPPPVDDTPLTTSTTVGDPVPEGEPLNFDRELPVDGQPEQLGPLGATETTVKTDEGEISIGGGSVPALAEGFPLPDDFELQLASDTETDVGFSGRTDLSLDDLVEFYEAALPDNGWEVVETQRIEGVLARFSVEGPLTGDLVISAEPGGAGWTILVALAR